MKAHIGSMKQKPQGVAADSAERTLKRAIGYGALLGLILAPVATAIAVGFDSALIYFRYAIHWAVGFSVIGAWAGAMFFSGEYSAVGHPDSNQ
jgi:Mg/Co/Ni transporter MgtE